MPTSRPSRAAGGAGLRVPGPATYPETFEVFGDAGLLDVELRNAMVRMAKFRIVDQNLADLAMFKSAVLGWA